MSAHLLTLPLGMLSALAAPAQELPPSVDVYTNVADVVGRRGLEEALRETYPHTRWRILPAEAAEGVQVPPDAWALKIEAPALPAPARPDDGVDSPPPRQVVTFTLRTPAGEAVQDAPIHDAGGGGWLTPLGVGAAAVCWPCPPCSGLPLGLAHTLATVILAGPSALGAAVRGGCCMGCGTCGLGFLGMCPPVWIRWPLEGSKGVRELDSYYRLRNAGRVVFPTLVPLALTNKPPAPDEPRRDTFSM